MVASGAIIQQISEMQGPGHAGQDQGQHVLEALEGETGNHWIHRDPTELPLHTWGTGKVGNRTGRVICHQDEAFIMVWLLREGPPIRGLTRPEGRVRPLGLPPQILRWPVVTLGPDAMVSLAEYSGSRVT